MKVERINMTSCTDPVVGDILSSWRYDISGISPEMRTDYEQHLEECQHCRSRQRLHRTVDVVLIGISTVSMLAFLLALAVIHRVEPLRNWAVVNLHLRQMDVVLTLQAAAVVGLLVSILAWILVAIATPAPVYLTSMALSQARGLQNRTRTSKAA
jgi:CBS domain containing-hemolysin-like protein